MDNREVEKILGLLDRVTRVDGDPWLYERVLARVRRPEEEPLSAQDRWVWALVTGILLINIAAVWLERSPGLLASPAKAFVLQYANGQEDTDLMYTPFSR